MGENKYRGKIKVKIGPVTTNFDGQVEFTELDDVNYHFRVKGRGSDKQGRGGATMEMAMDLQESEQGQTRVDCSMRVSITGRIAQFGARMIHAVNNKMFDRFTTNFHLLLEKQAAGEEFAANEDNVVNAGAMVGFYYQGLRYWYLQKKRMTLQQSPAICGCRRAISASLRHSGNDAHFNLRRDLSKESLFICTF